MGFVIFFLTLRPQTVRIGLGAAKSKFCHKTLRIGLIVSRTPDVIPDYQWQIVTANFPCTLDGICFAETKSSVGVIYSNQYGHYQLYPGVDVIYLFNPLCWRPKDGDSKTVASYPLTLLMWVCQNKIDHWHICIMSRKIIEKKTIRYYEGEKHI